MSILETVKITLANNKQRTSIKCKSGEETSISFKISIPDTEIPNSKILGVQLQLEQEATAEWIVLEGTVEQRLFIEKTIEKGEGAGSRIGENIAVVKISPPANLLDEKDSPKNYWLQIRVYDNQNHEADPVSGDKISLTIKSPRSKRKKLLGMFQFFQKKLKSG